MPFKCRSFIGVLLLATLLQLAGCAKGPAQIVEEEPLSKVEHFDSGPIASRIVLTADAADRIGIQTVAVRIGSGAPATNMIPYAAVLYDTEGKTWVYTNLVPLTYERSLIIVEDVQGDMAIVTEGLSNDVSVVTDGATELYGSESEFEEE